MNFNLVCFYSEGPPLDNAMPLSHCRKKVYEHAKSHFNNISFYNPSILNEMSLGEYVKSRPAGCVDTGTWPAIGNCAWKPLIMLLELEKMQFGDVLVYRDCDVDKRSTLKDYDNIKQHSLDLLSLCGFDFFIGVELFGRQQFARLKSFCKPNVIKELSKNKKFSEEFPMCIVDFLVARKSNASIALLTEWKEACLNERWIDGELYGESIKGMSGFFPEQAILNVIISNWIVENKFDIPKEYPAVGVLSRNIKNIFEIKDKSYLSNLDV
tara:strand:- start:396 stop:1199 length:804 start_codon:yes stop_codon:yes gene_type:complete